MAHLPNQPHIDVVVAIISNAQDEILIAKRAEHKHQGGLWEFPGGKVETGESIEAALTRELNEELGIQVKNAQHFMQLTHAYPDKDITLHVWRVTQFSGEAYGREGQPIQWVSRVQLAKISFPDANQLILDKLLANTLKYIS